MKTKQQAVSMGREGSLTWGICENEFKIQLPEAEAAYPIVHI